MIRIQSNGSKWAGEAPDTIEQLFAALKDYALDRRFEEYGNFIYTLDELGEPHLTRFWGNFATLSHVFSIDTDDPALIERLTTAIRENQKRPDYLSQPDSEERRRIQEERHRDQMERRQKERERQARAILGLEAQP